MKTAKNHQNSRCLPFEKKEVPLTPDTQEKTSQKLALDNTNRSPNSHLTPDSKERINQKPLQIISAPYNAERPSASTTPCVKSFENNNVISQDPEVK